MAFEDIVKAYKRVYSKAQLEAALRVALDDRASGVTVTKVSYEGGESSGVINGNTDDLIVILNTCLEELEGEEPASPVSHFDYSTQRVGT